MFPLRAMYSIPSGLKLTVSEKYQKFFKDQNCFTSFEEGIGSFYLFL